MVDFIRKRLQVFVSSTFNDLRQERQAAVEAILTAHHIPAGMELFTAGDESQMKVIKQWIDESDVYLAIIGGRYGAIEPKTGKSYTQLEYEYALEQEKPLFACVIAEAARKERAKLGEDYIETENSDKFRDFKANVTSVMVEFWSDPRDIQLAIHKKLNEFARREDLKGWVRGGEEVNAAELANEITRLSRENSELRRQIANNIPEKLFNGVSFSEIVKILENKDMIKFLQRDLSESKLLNDITLISKKSAEIKPFKEMCFILEKFNFIDHRGVFTQDGAEFIRLLEARFLMQNFYGNLQEDLPDG